VLLTVPSVLAKGIVKNAGRAPKNGRPSMRSFWWSSTFLMGKLQPTSLREFCELCNGLSPETIAERTASMTPEAAALFATKYAGLTPAENSEVVRFLGDKTKIPKDPSPALTAMIDYIKGSMLNSPSFNVPTDSMIVFSFKPKKRADEYAVVRDIVFGYPVKGGTEAEAEESTGKRERPEDENEGSSAKRSKTE
jgi:hypothetical protein